MSALGITAGLASAATLALLVACSGNDPAGPGADGGSGGSHAQGGKSSTGGSSSQAGRGGNPGQAGKSENEGGTEAGGDGAGGEGQGGDGQIPLRGACETSKRLGRFTVERQKDFGVVQGTVLDGVVPTSVPELVVDQDGCQVLRRRNLACSPACTASETCGEGGKCIAYPRQMSVGGVSIEGLTKAVAMDPQQPGAVYFAPGQDNPPFKPRAQVHLHAAGADKIAPFDLFGRGSEPLKEAPSWVLEQGKPLALTWPAGDTSTTVTVELTIDQHGSSPLSLACNFPDTGSAQIPSALIDQLITSGVSGFPNGRIQRRTVDHVEQELGCIELSIGSALSAQVRVAGFTPCKSDEDCPSGTTCDVAQERCF